MNIIYVRMPEEIYQHISVPSDAVARELFLLGHKVTIVDNPNDTPVEKQDFIWAPYESVTILGDVIAKKLNTPLFSHIEVLPPWRVVPNSNPEEYGLPKDSEEARSFNKTHAYYMKVGQIWKNAAIKTISTPVRIPMHEKLLGSIKNLQVRFPSVDVKTIEAAKKQFSPYREKNRVITVSRLTHIKRHDLLVQVMNQVQTKVEWLIVGDGPYKQVIEQTLTNKNVTPVFVGSSWGWSKLYYMLSSSVMVYAMGAMPPLEAALCGCSPIVIEQNPTTEIPEFDKFMESNVGNSMPIFKHTQTKEMAELIDKQINCPTILEEYDTVNKFLTGGTNVTPSSVNANNIIKLMEQYV